VYDQRIQICWPCTVTLQIIPWLLNDRRHSRDYEVLTANSEARIPISMIRLLLK
jgi:hypothetical protein